MDSFIVLFITNGINWQLIIDNYDEIIRYLAALKTGTTEVEVILKRGCSFLPYRFSPCKFLSTQIKHHYIFLI